MVEAHGLNTDKWIVLETQLQVKLRFNICSSRDTECQLLFYCIRVKTKADPNPPQGLKYSWLVSYIHRKSVEYVKSKI